MGINESKDKEKEITDIMQSPIVNTHIGDQIFGNYTFIDKLNDIRYGNVKLVQDKRNGKLYILKEILLNTKESYDEEAQIISIDKLRIILM